LQTAGLAAGDLIVSVNELRVQAADIERLLATARLGDRWQVHAFKRDLLRVVTLEPQAAEATTVVLKAPDPLTPEIRQWLQPEL